jgi:hypothetical protein
MEIKPAVIEDAEAILALQLLAYQSEAAIYDDFTLEIAGEADREKTDRPACPVCGGQLLDIRRKLSCVRCHAIIETCCD